MIVGDVVVTIDGSGGVVEALEVIIAPQTMYNLTVDEAHTYFVGDGEWLVHNTCELRYNSEGEIIGYDGDAPGSAGIRVPRQVTPDEMVRLTRQGNVEFGHGRELHHLGHVDGYIPQYREGDFWLWSGDDAHQVYVPQQIGADVYIEFYYHTHPSGKTTPSRGDINDLGARHWQRESGIIPVEDGPARVIPFNRLTSHED